MQPFSITHIVAEQDPKTVCEFVHSKSPLSKSKIKDAMLKGAVWLQRPGQKMQRVRRALKILSAGDRVSVYYNADILSKPVVPPTLVSDRTDYSVWDKPSGLLSQGTKYGDHISLLRQVELVLSRECYLVHRLDREASGLMVVAHKKFAAQQLSQLFQTSKIHKQYKVIVQGNLLSAYGTAGTIDFSLDNKPAITHYAVDCVVDNKSVVNVVIKTGRKHQIRRHFELLGFPVLGDPRYGKGNAWSAGLCLVATKLEFVCPVLKSPVTFKLENGEKRLNLFYTNVESPAGVEHVPVT